MDQLVLSLKPANKRDRMTRWRHCLIQQVIGFTRCGW